MQDVWQLVICAQNGCGFQTVGLVNAAVERLRTETDLLQHQRYNFRVDGFAVVRGAGESDFLVGKSKPFSGAGNQQRESLKRLRGGPQERHVVWRAQRSHDVPVGFNSDNVASVSRFGDSSATDFDQRFGDRNL